MSKARILALAILSFLIVGFLALEDAAARKRKVLVPGYHSKAVEIEVPVGGPVLEVGELPDPLPSRLRVVIQPNKGDVCFQCHKIPYPTAPTEPAKPWQTKLSSILTTPRGMAPADPCRGTLQLHGRRLQPGWKAHSLFPYSLRLSEKNWDIWVVDANGKNRTPLVTGLYVDKAPDWSTDGKAIVFQSDREGSSDIWRMDLASQRLTQLTQDPREERAQVVSRWEEDRLPIRSLGKRRHLDAGDRLRKMHPAHLPSRHRRISCVQSQRRSDPLRLRPQRKPGPLDHECGWIGAESTHARSRGGFGPLLELEMEPDHLLPEAGRQPGSLGDESRWKLTHPPHHSSCGGKGPTLEPGWKMHHLLLQHLGPVGCPPHAGRYLHGRSLSQHGEAPYRFRGPGGRCGLESGWKVDRL